MECLGTSSYKIYYGNKGIGTSNKGITRYCLLIIVYTVARNRQELPVLHLGNLKLSDPSLAGWRRGFWCQKIQGSQGCT